MVCFDFVLQIQAGTVRHGSTEGHRDRDSKSGREGMVKESAEERGDNGVGREKDREMPHTTLFPKKKVEAL